MNPLNEFGSVTNSTTTYVVNSTSTQTQICDFGGSESCTVITTAKAVATTIVQTVPTPDWTIPILIFVVLAIVAVVIGVARRKKKI